MPAKLIYLDTCYPDYFQGYSGGVIAVNVSRDMTVIETKESIIEQWIQDDDLKISVEELNESLLTMFKSFDESAKPFDHLESDSEESESYLYLGVTNTPIDALD